MTRGISAATLAAIESDSAAPVMFAELQLDGGTEYYHTWLGTITWGGNDWIGAGQMASVESVKETKELQPNALRIGLSGLDANMTDIMFNQNYYRRPLIGYLGAMSDGALIEDPSVIFSGFIESLEMEMGEQDSIVLTAESELILFKRSRDVRYTDTRLQSEFSGDLGLQFKESVATDRIVWGGKNNGLGGGRQRDDGPPTFERPR